MYEVKKLKLIGGMPKQIYKVLINPLYGGCGMWDVGLSQRDISGLLLPLYSSIKEPKNGRNNSFRKEVYF